MPLQVGLKLPLEPNQKINLFFKIDLKPKPMALPYFSKVQVL
jgi:hypothetical protein